MNSSPCERNVNFLFNGAAGKLRRTTAHRKDAQHKQEGFSLKEKWKKGSEGLIPTGNVFLIPPGEDEEEPGELAGLAQEPQLIFTEGKTGQAGISHSLVALELLECFF